MININGEDWFIKFVSEYHPLLYRSDGSLSIASCDDNSKTIYINNQLTGRFYVTN